jgi:hypothetical protein
MLPTTYDDLYGDNASYATSGNMYDDDSSHSTTWDDNGKQHQHHQHRQYSQNQRTGARETRVEARMRLKPEV